MQRVNTQSSPVGSQHGTPSATRRTAAVSGLTTLGILAVAFGAMALGVPYFWVVFPVGFGGVLPLVLAYSGRTASGSGETAAEMHSEAVPTTTDPSSDEALRTLRARYARGEMTDEAFERQLERLLQTESVAEAAKWTPTPTTGAATRDERDDGE